MRLLGVLLLVVTVVFANRDEDDFLKEVVQFLDGCQTRSLSLCFTERALSYVEQLPNDIEIGGTFAVKKNTQNDGDRSDRHLSRPQLPEEPRAREEVLGIFLLERIYEYLETHTFEFKVPTETIQEFKRSLEEEARKKKKKNQMMPLLLLFQLKAAIIGAMILKTFGVIAFKALLLSKIALTIVSIIGLKKLFEHKHHSSTYEVVAHPHYSEEHGHYDRSFSQDFAYRGYQDTKGRSEKL